MRLSHKRKVAHKRSGAAKGWAKVMRCRQEVRKALAEAIMMAIAYSLQEHVVRQRCVLPSEVVDEEKPKPSLLTRGVSMVAGMFHRLKAAGAAQRNLLQGRQ